MEQDSSTRRRSFSCHSMFLSLCQGMWCTGSRRLLSGTRSPTPASPSSCRGGRPVAPSILCSHSTGSCHLIIATQASRSVSTVRKYLTELQQPRLFSITTVRGRQTECCGSLRNNFAFSNNFLFTAKVDCSDDTAVFAHCFPHTLLGMFLDGIPFCEFKPLQAIQTNRWFTRTEKSWFRLTKNISEQRVELRQCQSQTTVCWQLWSLQ